MGRNRRSLRTVALVALAACWNTGLSCRSPARQEGEGPRPKLLEGRELEISMSRIGEYPRRVVTSASSVPVRVYMDPGLADVRRVREYAVWCRPPGTREWEKLGTMPPLGDPLRIEPGEGMHGLRASAVYDDGSEVLVPGVTDEPALWLCVDRSPPAIAWISPRPNTSIRGMGSIDLVWSQSEAQFGAEPARLEWSADRGATWRPIASVPAAPGQSSWRWRIPDEVTNDVEVRVVSRDLSGHEAAASLGLLYPAFAADRPAVAAAPAPAVAKPPAAAPAPPMAAPPAAAAPSAQPEGSPSPAAASGARDSLEPPRSIAGAPAWVETPVVDAPPATRAPDPAPPASPTEAMAERPEEAAAVPVEEAGLPRLPPDVAALEPLPRRMFRGGEAIPVSWVWMGPPVDARALVEWTKDDGAAWLPAAEAHVSAGRIEFAAPAESAACALRLRIAPARGEAVETPGQLGFTVDADPPAARFVRTPETAGSRAVIEVTVSDAGGAGPASIEVFGRRGGSGWKALPGARTHLDGRAGPRSLDLDLSGEAEGPMDLWLRSEDGAGNTSPEAPAGAGDSAAGALARIRLDRTPPSLAAQAPPVAWVSGFQAEVQAAVDWTDAMPPLAIEGSSGGEGEWIEIGRWTSLAPGQDRFGFQVPAAVAEYRVRLTVTDAAGNRAQAVVGPRPVEPPLRLASFTESGRTYAARGAEKIRWTLHPAAAEVAEDLRVSIAHQASSGGKWVALYENLPALAESYWELPPGDLEEHRIRVRLLRGGKALGEDVSPPFSIGGADAEPPSVVKIDPESIFYSNQARSLVERYFAAIQGGGAAGTEEIQKLGTEIVAGYERALSMDANNYHATYGLAQFLNRADPDGNAKAVLGWLGRTLEIKRDHFWALNDLGALHIRDGRYAQAEEVLRKCQAIEPSVIVLYNLGLSLFYGGKPAEARKRFEEALHANGSPGVPEGEIYYYLCHSYLEEGNAERARGIFKEKEKLIPADLRDDLARRF